MSSILRLISILPVLSLISCASKKTDPSETYETFNDQLEQVSKSGSSSRLITNFEDIPKFKDTKGDMAPGHLFYLSHPSDEKLKGRFRVDFKGLLRLPYNVTIKVKGLSFSELKKEVHKRYSKFFKRGVENVEFRLLRRDYLVEVRGLVEDSGRYYIARNEGIDKLIDKAGGLRGEMEKNFYKAAVVQQGESYSISLNQYYNNGKFNNAFNWTGGDKVFVTELDESEMTSSLPIVTILAGVNNPGKVLYKPKAHLFYYIGKSGGAIDNLDYDESYIIRTAADGMYKIHFNLTETEAIPALAPNDIVLLQAEKESMADKIMNRIVQFATILTSVAVLLAL